MPYHRARQGSFQSKEFPIFVPKSERRPTNSCQNRMREKHNTHLADSFLDQFKKNLLVLSTYNFSFYLCSKPYSLPFPLPNVIPIEKKMNKRNITRYTRIKPHKRVSLQCSPFAKFSSIIVYLSRSRFVYMKKSSLFFI